jgi:hypothetical protein
MNTFDEPAYQEHQAHMKALAEEDGDAFLPNLTPRGRVDYIFICMEPSLGRWAYDAACGKATVERARAEVERGVRNFLPSGDLAMLYYAASKFLPAGRCYMTDISKGAMPITKANIDRTQRYNRWFPSLLKEISIVAAPGAKFFAVGNAVEKQLNDREFPHPFTTILHYSSVAAPHRAHAVRGHEESFEEFKLSMSRERLREVAEDVFAASCDVPQDIRDYTFRKHDRKPSNSLAQLAFTYKLAFSAEAQA